MLKKSLYLAGLFFVLATAQIQANSWKSIGLDSLKINCMYTTGNHIFAGTEKGLYIYGDMSQKWIKLAGVPDLPISDIIAGIAGSGSEIILSTNAGGSNSDGIYIGLDMLNGEPYYVFQPLKYAMFVENIGYYNDTLLFGGKNNLLSATRLPIKSLWPQFSDPKKVTIPQDVFGNNTPYCSEIKHSEFLNSFLASGYDKNPIIPVKGMLTSGNSSKLAPFFEKNITSFLETFTGALGSNAIYAGTLDKVYKLSLSTTTVPSTISDTTIIATPQNIKVNHISTTNKGEITIGGVGYICIATDDGVFLTSDDKTWNELGDIPQKPTMLVEYINSKATESTTSLYAATDKGVYLYEFAGTAIADNKNSSNKKINNIAVNSNIVTIKTSNRVNKNIDIDIYSISGKKVSSLNYQNSKSVSLNFSDLNLSSGRYFLNVKIGNESFGEKINYLR